MEGYLLTKHSAQCPTDSTMRNMKTTRVFRQMVALKTLVQHNDTSEKNLAYVRIMRFVLAHATINVPNVYIVVSTNYAHKRQIDVRKRIDR